MTQTILTWLASNIVALATIFGGLFAFVRWMSERKEVRQERRTQEYWTLLDRAVGAEIPEGKRPMKAHQIAALYMLKSYPEFSQVTKAVLGRLIEEPGDWSKAYEKDARAILSSLGERNR